MESKSIVIDYFKAFLLTWVIFLHIIEVDVNAPFFLTYIYDMFESFLMPVFIALSGYLISKTNLKNERWGEFLFKYTKRLIIPFLIALILERLLRTPNIDVFLISLKYAGQFWYILTLFLFILLLKISYTLNFSLLYQLILYSSLTILSVIDALTIQSFQIYYFHIYYFPFFLIGHYWKVFNWKLPRFYSLIFISSWIIMFISLLLHDQMYSIPKILTWMSTTLLSINFIHNIVPKKTIKIKEFFIYYGRNTLPVYLYHYLLILIAYALLKNIEYYLVALGFSSILIITVSFTSKSFSSDKILWVFGIKPLADYFNNKEYKQTYQ